MESQKSAHYLKWNTGRIHQNSRKLEERASQISDNCQKLNEINTHTGKDIDTVKKEIHNFKAEI